MATTYNNGIAVATGLNIQAPTPADDRTVVANVSDLTTIPNQYVGLICFVTVPQKPYVRVSSGWILLAGEEIIFDDAPTLGSTNAVTSNGIAEALDLKADLVNGLVPSYQLPGAIDEVVNGRYVDATTFEDLNGDPYTPSDDELYVDVDTNLVYRWSGVIYVETSTALALGETAYTAYRGDRGKTAYDHSQLTDANPHETTHAQILEKSGGEWHLDLTQYNYLTNVANNDIIGAIIGAITEPYPYVAPTSSITNVAGTYEVGSTQSISITQTFTQNNGGTKISEVITKNGVTASTTSSFSETLTVPLGNTTYSGSVSYGEGECQINNLGILDCTGHITAGNTTSPPRVVLGALRRYASSVSTLPTTGSGLRTALLGTSVINTANNFTFTTGTTNRRFVIAIPATKTLSTVQNTGTNEFLNFTLSSTITTVPDAAGTNQSYKVYTLENAVPFPNNYTLNVILI